jgi:biopolymer transport protein ExbB
MPVFRPSFLLHVFACYFLLISFGVAAEKTAPWWKPEWTARKQITVDTTRAGGAIAEPIGGATILLRLYDGNFQFGVGKEDGSDLRFIAADGKTLLKHHVEKFDSLLYEAFVWVRVPEVKPGEASRFWLYYGNPAAERIDDPKATYDADSLLVYHFAENGTPAADSTANGISAESAGVPVSGALIGGGLRLTGGKAVSIPANPAFTWKDRAPLTWSAWIKPTTLQANAVLFSRRDDAGGIVIGENQGVPYVEITGPSGTQRTAAGTPLAVNVWRHLAVVSAANQTTLYLDGESYATIPVVLPALNTPALLGKDAIGNGAPSEAAGFVGEIDELEIARVARSIGWLKLAAISQSGSEKAAKVLTFGEDESAGHGGAADELAKHLSLITDISKSLTFDGWVVIVLCVLLAVVGWIVTIAKFVYLTRITKATNAFLQHWKQLSKDLHVLDHGDTASIKSMGGKANNKSQKVMAQSPLYHIYQIGSEEIQHRLSRAREGIAGLSGRSVGAIRATLDGGLVREVQRLNKNLVFLTIGIAGGPYLGLLGTVIGVMITFAVIAKSGEVEVNSIAPGIAGALLATVAGLAVAIPALFAYSYISSRIKDAVSEMQIFIDEFVAKIAEFYPSAND